MLAIAARGFQCVQRRVVHTRLLATPSQKSMAATFRAGLLYADNHVLCLNKPAGMLSQLDRTGDASVNEYALAWLGEERNTKFAAAVHRLDRPVSGCLLVAASSKAAKRLSKSLADGKVSRRFGFSSSSTISTAWLIFVLFCAMSSRVRVPPPAPCLSCRTEKKTFAFGRHEPLRMAAEYLFFFW